MHTVFTVGGRGLSGGTVSMMMLQTRIEQAGGFDKLRIQQLDDMLGV